MHDRAASPKLIDMSIIHVTEISRVAFPESFVYETSLNNQHILPEQYAISYVAPFDVHGGEDIISHLGSRIDNADYLVLAGFVAERAQVKIANCVEKFWHWFERPLYDTGIFSPPHFERGLMTGISDYESQKLGRPGDRIIIKLQTSRNDPSAIGFHGGSVGLYDAPIKEYKPEYGSSGGYRRNLVEVFGYSNLPFPEEPLFGVVVFILGSGLNEKGIRNGSSANLFGGWIIMVIGSVIVLGSVVPTLAAVLDRVVF